MKRGHFLLVLLLLGYFGLFLYRGIVITDPDFGWHIQAGNTILKHGIPYTDPFSYSMPSYPFVDHEWLTNVLWALTYRYFGILPLACTMAFLASMSLLFPILVIKKKWVSVLLFLAGGTFFDFSGIRTQVITWFFLSVLITVLFEQKLWQKFRFFLPLLFLVWANLHGGFGIGIGVLAIVLLGKAFEERKNSKEKLLIFGFCLAATLINPFGTRLWWEFWMQLSDSQLRFSIAEWYPAVYFGNIAFWSYFAISLFLIIVYRKKYPYTLLFLYFFLLIEGLLSMRNIPIWVIVSLPLTIRGIALLKSEAAGLQHGTRRFVTAYYVFFLIVFCMFLSQLGTFFYSTVVLKEYQNAYPASAVRYLQKHTPKGEIFSSYDWGGYLIWQLPEKKVFIDGRMPSWRWQANKQGQSNYAFDEYKKVLAGDIPLVSFTTKYHISTLLVPRAALTEPAMKLFGVQIKKNSFLSILFPPWQSFSAVVTEAKAIGWREVYHDNTAVILEVR